MVPGCVDRAFRALAGTAHSAEFTEFRRAVVGVGDAVALVITAGLAAGETVSLDQALAWATEAATVRVEDAAYTVALLVWSEGAASAPSQADKDSLASYLMLAARRRGLVKPATWFSRFARALVTFRDQDELDLAAVGRPFADAAMAVEAFVASAANADRRALLDAYATVTEQTRTESQGSLPDEPLVLSPTAMLAFLQRVAAAHGGPDGLDAVQADIERAAGAVAGGSLPASVAACRSAAVCAVVQRCTAVVGASVGSATRMTAAHWSRICHRMCELAGVREPKGGLHAAFTAMQACRSRATPPFPANELEVDRCTLALLDAWLALDEAGGGAGPQLPSTAVVRALASISGLTDLASALVDTSGPESEEHYAPEAGGLPRGDGNDRPAAAAAAAGDDENDGRGGLTSPSPPPLSMRPQLMQTPGPVPTPPGTDSLARARPTASGRRLRAPIAPRVPYTPIRSPRYTPSHRSDRKTRARLLSLPGRRRSSVQSMHPHIAELESMPPVRFDSDYVRVSTGLEARHKATAHKLPELLNLWRPGNAINRVEVCGHPSSPRLRFQLPSPATARDRTTASGQDGPSSPRRAPQPPSGSGNRPLVRAKSTGGAQHRSPASAATGATATAAAESSNGDWDRFGAVLGKDRIVQLRRANARRRKEQSLGANSRTLDALAVELQAARGAKAYWGLEVLRLLAQSKEKRGEGKVKEAAFLTDQAVTSARTVERDLPLLLVCALQARAGLFSHHGQVPRAVEALSEAVGIAVTVDLDAAALACVPELYALHVWAKEHGKAVAVARLWVALADAAAQLHARRQARGKRRAPLARGGRSGRCLFPDPAAQGAAACEEVDKKEDAASAETAAELGAPISELAPQVMLREARRHLALSLIASGRAEEGVEMLTEMLDEALRVRDMALRAVLRACIGRSHAEAHEHALAANLMEERVENVRCGETHLREAREALVWMSESAAAAGRHHDAVRAAERYLACAKAADSRIHLMEAYYVLADRVRGSAEAARREPPPNPLQAATSAAITASRASTPSMRPRNTLSAASSPAGSRRSGRGTGPGSPPSPLPSSPGVVGSGSDAPGGGREDDEGGEEEEEEVPATDPLGEVETAVRQLLEKAAGFATTIDHVEGQARTALGRAGLEKFLGRHERAVRALEQALSTYRDGCPMRVAVAETQLALAEARCDVAEFGAEESKDGSDNSGARALVAVPMLTAAREELADVIATVEKGGDVGRQVRATVGLVRVCRLEQQPCDEDALFDQAALLCQQDAAHTGPERLLLHEMHAHEVLMGAFSRAMWASPLLSSLSSRPDGAELLALNRALAPLREALVACTSLRWRDRQAQNHLALLQVRTRLHHWSEAEEHLEAVRALAAELEDAHLQVQVEEGAGRMWTGRQRYARAVDCFKNAVEAAAASPHCSALHSRQTQLLGAAYDLWYNSLSQKRRVQEQFKSVRRAVSSLAGMRLLGAGRRRGGTVAHIAPAESGPLT